MQRRPAGAVPGFGQPFERVEPVDRSGRLFGDDRDDAPANDAELLEPSTSIFRQIHCIGQN